MSSLVSACPSRVEISRGLHAQELDQLGQVGRRQINHHEVSLDLFRNGSHRRSDDDELLAVEAEVVEVAQTAANGSGILQWLVKILEVEDAAFGMLGDEIQASRGSSAGAFGLILARQTLGETPGPYRNRDGGS